MFQKAIISMMVMALCAGSGEWAIAAGKSAPVSSTPQPSSRQSNGPATGRSAPPMDNDFIDAGVLEGVDTVEGGLEIGGILTDETVTKFGHELFDAFNRYWKPPEGASFNIGFSERFDAARGSFITVRLNEMPIFEGFLTPREEAINELGKALAKDIRNLIRNTANLEEEEFY